MSKVIGVFSVKGGVGKTTIAVNLASAMVRWFGKSVILVDTNVSSAHVGLHFNLYEDSAVTVRDVIGKRSLDANIHSHKVSDSGYTIGELKVLPCPLKGDDRFLSHQRLGDLLKRLKEKYEYVILDTAPGADGHMNIAADSVDEAIIVSTPDIPTITDTLKTIGILKGSGKRILGVVLNKVSGRHYEVREKEVGATCECEVMAKIPEDSRVQESIAKGVPAVIHYPRSQFSKSVKMLASRVLGEYREETGIWQRLKNLFSVRAATPEAIMPPEAARFGTESKRRERARPKAPVVREEPVAEERKDLREELKKEIIRKVREKLKESGAMG